MTDRSAYDWFLLNIDGTENLQILTINEIFNISDFQDYDQKYIETKNNKILSNVSSREIGIINCDILKIGNIKSKDSELDVYNLHLQVSTQILETRKITISLGNLNTSGI